MKVIHLVDDAVEKLEVAQEVKFSDLAKQAPLQAQFLQLQSQNTNFFNKVFINGNEFTSAVSIGVTLSTAIF